MVVTIIIPTKTKSLLLMSTIEVAEKIYKTQRISSLNMGDLENRLPDYDVKAKKQLLVEKRKQIREQLKLLIKRSCGPLSEAELSKCIPGRKLTVDGVRVGEVIDEKYRVEKLLDSGSMGNIFIVRDLDNKAVYAMKTLVEAVHSEKGVRRFIREAKELSKLDHKHIINVVDFGMSNGRPYYVMENLSGGLGNEPSNMETMIKMFHQQKVSLKEMIGYFAQIAEGLNYLHTREQTVIHRDLKPANVLVNNKNAKLVDFGVASVSGNTLTTLTCVNEIVGTPHYLPITDWELNKVTPKSDMYSLGVMLFYLMTKRLPYDIKNKQVNEVKNEPINDRVNIGTVDYISTPQEGPDVCLVDTPVSKDTPGSGYNNRKDTILELFRRARRDEPVYDGILPAVDEELVKLAKRLLSKDPDERPDAKEVAKTLHWIQSATKEPTPAYLIMSMNQAVGN